MKKTVSSPKAPAAVGPYSQAVATAFEQTLYISGQLPIDGATGVMPDSVEAQTEQSLKNIGYILEEAGLGFGDVVKTTVLLQHMSDFNAMNEVYARFFPDSKPARVCFEVAALPKGALVEIDAVAGR